MTAPIVLREDHDGVACLTIDTGPGNPVTTPLRLALLAALGKALRDDRVGTVLLRSAGRDFSLGLTPEASVAALDPPTPGDLARTIETAGRPVLVALQGRVRGVAAELALAAHYRIAAPDLELAFDGVALGLAPLAGAGQRLARLVGVGPALEHLVDGTSIDAATALGEGLVDRIADGPLEAAARRWAAQLAAECAPAQPLSDSDRPVREAAAGLAAVRAMRARIARLAPDHLRPAREAIVDAVEGTMLLPVDLALEVDAARAEDLRDAPVARALCHRAAALAHARTGGEAWPAALPRRAHLVWPGQETPAADALAADAVALAVRLARAGFDIDIPAAPDAVAAALDLAGLAPLPPALAGRLHVGPSGAPAGLVIAPANGAQTLAAAAGIDAAEGAAILLIARAAAGDPPLAAPPGHALARLRLHGPAGRSGLVELVAPPATGAVLGHLLRQGGLAVVRSEAAQALSDALAGAMARVLAYLVATGTPAETLRQTLQDWGFARLPHLPETGAAGQAAGPVPERIVLCVLAALVNEGARLLQGGAAIRPGDVDLAACLGAGFPDWRGGPLHVADGWPLVSLRREMQGLVADAPVALAPRARSLWDPAPMLAEMVKNGWGFADLEPG